jgi:uncharacterized protein (TIGR03435 family)
MILPPGLPSGKFDFLLTVPDPKAALREEIRKKFGVVAHSEMRETDVFIVRTAGRAGPALRTSVTGRPWVSSQSGKISVTGFKMSGQPGEPGIADCLEMLFGKPVIDESGLSDTYDLELTWPARFDIPRSIEQKKQVERALREQAGLELVPARRTIPLLVVEKVKS